MPIGERDKKALKIAGAAVVLFLVVRYGVFPLWDHWQQERSELPVRERTLAKYREALGATGSRHAEAASLEAGLQDAERGLLSGRSAALASAELQDSLKRLTAAEGIEVRSSDFQAAKPLGSEYVQVPLGLQFQCRLDQLVNFLNALHTGEKSLAVSRLFIQSDGGKGKVVSVNMTVAGVMRREEELGVRN